MGKNSYNRLETSTGQFEELDSIKPEMISLNQNDEFCEVIYQNKFLEATVTRTFNQNGNLVESYKIKNISHTVITVNRDNTGIEVPFNDRYPYADECMIHHCNTHIWCGHNITWINALKMGVSDCNLGLYLTKGAIDCYNQEFCGHSNRGNFILCPESLFLKSGEEYEIEWEIFVHNGNDDFFNILNKYNGYIGINAKHYTVFENEDIDFIINAKSEPTVKCNDTIIPIQKTEYGYRVVCNMPAGEYRFYITVGNQITWAEFCVKIPFSKLLEKRINFIIDNQQCLDKDSPLYGAFLIFDNDYDS